MDQVLIPLFPLPLVLFPGAVAPLHIFENRYKTMMADVLAGNETFGIVRVEDSRKLAKVGCLAKITAVERLADGRMNIFAEGVTRFSIEALVDDLEYTQARVLLLEEPVIDKQTQKLADELKVVVLDVIRLSEKLAGETMHSDKVPSDPLGLSYWIADCFYTSQAEQQKLLEKETTVERLQAERIRLDATCKQLAARTALKDVFS